MSIQLHKWRIRFRFSRIKPSLGGSGGLITYGALDTKNCDSQWNYVPLSSLGYWQFSISGVQIGSYKSTRKQEAISDTGSSWLGGPPDQVDAIVGAIGATYNFDQGTYTVECDAKNLPDIVFVIGGNRYAIPQKEYILDVGLGNNECAVTLWEINGIGADGQVLDWALGDTFIRTYCNAYDVGQKRIGFAKARHSFQ
ncbi:aspartic protease [Aphelenchoides avenae]|nr:aspartic protease [Aphelenchus avenae]